MEGTLAPSIFTHFCEVCSAREVAMLWKLLLAIFERGLNVGMDGYQYGFSIGPELPIETTPAPALGKAKKAKLTVVGKSRRSTELKKLRERSGLSQVKFAAMCGCSGPHISNAENGKCQPSLRLVRAAREVAKIVTAPADQAVA